MSATASYTGAVKVIFGTMGIPSPLHREAAKEALQLFRSKGHRDIDTAIMYQAGTTEKILGDLDVAQSFSIAIKANPWYKDGKTYDNPVGGLAPVQLKEQLKSSFKSLNVKKVDLFYLHAPDHDTPIGDTLAAVKDLYDQGLFEEWGLSNYASWQVIDVYHRSKQMGLKPPSVYQGMYNAVTRKVQSELLPALRYCNMKFYAYNPLAGGILTGKWKFEDCPQQGRFNMNSVWGMRYRDRFWQKPLFDALNHVDEICKLHALTLTEASLRWLIHHSDLCEGDGVIIGGSSLQQISENVDACAGGVLPLEVVEALDQAWIAACPNCPSYFR